MPLCARARSPPSGERRRRAPRRPRSRRCTPADAVQAAGMTSWATRYHVALTSDDSSGDVLHTASQLASGDSRCTRTSSVQQLGVERLAARLVRQSLDARLPDDLVVARGLGDAGRKLTPQRCQPEEHVVDAAVHLPVKSACARSTTSWSPLSGTSTACGTLRSMPAQRNLLVALVMSLACPFVSCTVCQRRENT